MALFRSRNQRNEAPAEVTKDTYSGVTTRKRAALKVVADNNTERVTKLKLTIKDRYGEKENNCDELIDNKNDKVEIDVIQQLINKPIVWPTATEICKKDNLKILYKTLLERREAIRTYYVNIIDSEKPIWFQQNCSDEFMHSEYLSMIHDHLMEQEEFYEPLGTDFIADVPSITGSTDSLNDTIRSRHRYILVDWMVKVHEQLGFSNESLYLSVAMLDRFVRSVQSESIRPQDLYIFCAMCLFIAGKIEEVYCHTLHDFLDEVQLVYDLDKCRQIEERILSALDFKLSIPLSLAFIRHYNFIYKGDTTSHIYSRYFCELSMHDYVASGYSANMVGASCVYLAQVICQKTQERFDAVWTPALQCASGLLYVDIEPLVENLCLVVSKQPRTSKYRAIAIKYSDDRFRQVAKTAMSAVGYKSLVQHIRLRQAAGLS